MRSMSVVVFGPLTLEGVTLSPRERAVLSALVLRAGRPVTTDELADALWGDEPPGTWQKQLQASIGRVRAAIGRNAIATSPGAYTLRIDPDTVDAERFERLAASARQHLDDDPARAVDAAERALALWRGTPYADLASWAPAVVESERLDEVRMELEEVRVDGHLQARRARGIRRRRRAAGSGGAAAGTTLGAPRHRALPGRPPGRRARGDPRSARTTRR